MGAYSGKAPRGVFPSHDSDGIGAKDYIQDRDLLPTSLELSS